MKQLIRSTLLFLLLVLTGCGESNPVAAEGGPAELLTQAEIAESHALNFLASAKDFQDDGQPKYALSTLQELLEQFPDTEAAVEAKQMIAEIENHESDGGNSE